ncbi:hypothetical protein C9374_012578 [Naegleria lovaniensis]|uniref:Nuclear pore complex protein Nup85 n=1 Tax=Naegleria lovaniensis TaxID=51637 RepID=A0AA88H1E6_NAELO|nr:uncharacterized protein C9374_012578 [Naegleria lovaniensis]KAG2392326.1 hypothetical protein C9374_012578 [Naegleria lovaniensis]
MSNLFGQSAHEFSNFLSNFTPTNTSTTTTTNNTQDNSAPVLLLGDSLPQPKIDFGALLAKRKEESDDFVPPPEEGDVEESGKKASSSTNQPFGFGFSFGGNKPSSSSSSGNNEMTNVKETKGGFAFSFGSTPSSSSSTNTTPSFSSFQPSSSGRIPFSFGAPNSASSTTSTSSTKLLPEEKHPETSVVEVQTPKMVRSQKPPNTISFAKPSLVAPSGLSQFNLPSRKDQEDLLDNNSLRVLDADLSTNNNQQGKNTNKPSLYFPSSQQSNNTVDLNKTAPIQSNLSFNVGKSGSTFNSNKDSQQVLFGDNLSVSSSSSSTKPTKSRSIFDDNSSIRSSNSSNSFKSPLTNADDMEDDTTTTIEKIEYKPQQPSNYEQEELWWKILHESCEMFLFMQDRYSDDKLDKNTLEKSIAQFKTMLYEGLSKISSFEAYYDIFNAIEIFYFYRFSRGSLLQKLVKWYLKSCIYVSNQDTSDSAIYRQLILGEAPEKIIDTIRDFKSDDLDHMKVNMKELYRYYESFFKLLSKKPNILKFKAISATLEEYLDETQHWKVEALRLKRELKALKDATREYQFLSECFDIVTGDEDKIVEQSNNWLEVMIGLILHKYQRFSDINEIIDLAVHAKDMKEDNETHSTLEAICLLVIGNELDTTVKSIQESLSNVNDDRSLFQNYWFIAHITNFLFHINTLYQKLYISTNSESFIHDLSILRSQYLRDLVTKEILPYYNEIDRYSSLENDLWKVAIDYLSYCNAEPQDEIHDIIKGVLLNISVSNEYQLDKIYRYIKDTPFAKSVVGHLHLNLGEKCISEKNYATGIYHIYKSNDRDKLESVIREISTTNNLRIVYYGLEEYGCLIDMQEIQWISSFFKILESSDTNIHLLPSTLACIPNDELKLELLTSIDLSVLKYAQIVSVMSHLEEMEFHFMDLHEKQQQPLDTLSELRLILARTLQIKILE